VEWLSRLIRVNSGCLISNVNKHQTLDRDGAAYASVLFLPQYKLRVAAVSDTGYSFDRPFFPFETLTTCLLPVHSPISTSIGLLETRHQHARVQKITQAPRSNPSRVGTFPQPQ
jgi:hypothetical protein